MTDTQGTKAESPKSIVTLDSPKTYPDIIASINRLYNNNSFHFIKTNKKTASEVGRPEDEISFDTDSPDAIAVTYRQMRDKLLERIASDAQLKTLGPKETQIEYEKRLAVLSFEAIDNTIFARKNYRASKEGRTTMRNLNLLTDKVEDEYDCEHLSIVRGLLMHEADQRAVHLGLRSHTTQFYFMSGATNSAHIIGNHAFIASATTGNIIESTASDHGYRTSRITFEELIAGYPALTDKNDLYAHSSIRIDENTAAKRLSLLKKNPHMLEALEAMRATTTIQQEREKLTPEMLKTINNNKLIHCSDPIAVTSHYDLPIQTQEGALETVPHASNACLKNDAIDDRMIILERGKQVANRFISEKINTTTVSPSTAANDKIPLATPATVNAPHVPPSVKR